MAGKWLMVAVLVGAMAFQGLFMNLQAVGGPVAKSSTTIKTMTGNPEVFMYLKDGTDLKGRILSLENQVFTIRTAKGVRRVQQGIYQGMVLTTPEELDIGKKMTTNMDALIVGGTYSMKARQALDKGMQLAMAKARRQGIGLISNACKSTKMPVAHLLIGRSGKLKRAVLLTRSNCALINDSLVQAIHDARFAPLDKTYPLDAQVVNYFYSGK